MTEKVKPKSCPHCGGYYNAHWGQSLNDDGEWIGRCVVCDRTFVVSKEADE